LFGLERGAGFGFGGLGETEGVSEDEETNAVSCGAASLFSPLLEVLKLSI
jgi:hypothetical protein